MHVLYVSERVEVTGSLQEVNERYNNKPPDEWVDHWVALTAERSATKGKKV